MSGKYALPLWRGSDLTASLVDPAVKLKEILGASFVQRLAADLFEQAVAYQVDRVVAALAAITSQAAFGSSDRPMTS